MAVWEKSWIWFSTCFTCSFAMLWMCRSTLKGMFVLGTIKLIHFFCACYKAPTTSLLKGDQSLFVHARKVVQGHSWPHQLQGVLVSVSHTVPSPIKDKTVLIYSYCCIHGKGSSAAQPFITSRAQYRRIFFPQGWRPEYSCSPCGTSAFAQAQTDACVLSAMPCECLLPDWLLKLLGYSWDFFQDWVAIIFPLLLTTSSSQHSWMRATPSDWCTDCKWLGCTERQPHSSLLKMWAAGRLETLHLVNSLPLHTPLASRGRKWRAKYAATLKASIASREDVVGFHPRMLHQTSSHKKRQGDMHRNYPPCFILHSLLPVGTLPWSA